MADFRKGLLPLFAAGGAAAMMSPDEGQYIPRMGGGCWIYLIRRQWENFLRMNRCLNSLEELPKEIFEAAKKDNAVFKTPELAATRDSIQHY